MPPVCGFPHTGGMSISGDPTLKAVRELEDEFAEAMTRMYAVGNGLARLRTRLDHEASPRQWTPATSPSGALTARPGAVTAPPAAPPFVTTSQQTPAPTPPAAPGGSPVPWWQRDGMVARLLAVVGTGITLIGVAFLLALAIQMGFFGPLARVLSGVALAVVLVVAAVLVRRRQAGTAGALGLAASGIATAYLDVLAVTRIYEWVPGAAGLAIAGLVALGGLLLARVWASQLLAVATVLGVAVLAPVVGSGQPLLVGQFLLVLTLASWPAQVSRRWHVLEITRIAPTALAVTVLALADEPIGAVTLLACVLAGFVLVTSLAGVRVAQAPAQAGFVVPVASLPVLVATLVADRVPGAALAVALTVALLLVGGLTTGRAVAGEGGGTDLLLVGPWCLATAGVTSLVSAGLVAEGTGWFIAATLVVSVLWAAAALVLGHRVLLGVALGTATLPLIWTVALVPYAVDHALSPDVGVNHLVTTVLGVLLLLLLARAVLDLPRVAGVVLSRAFVAGALLGSGATVILAGILLGGLAGDPGSGFTAGQAGATVLWLVTAAVLLLRGLRGTTSAVPAGLAITALSVGKLLFFDLAFLDGIPRVLCFIVGGLIVLGTGAGYAQALERSRRGTRGTGTGGPVDNSGQGSDPAPTV